MIKKKILDALNKQINAELYSAYLYLSMSAYFESKNLKGFAHWMRKQSKEEQTHAMKIYDHIVERGDLVNLTSIGAPTADWKSVQAVFEHAYNHERKVTGMIHDIVEAARAEKDYATEAMLQWFVNEQVEEEAQADEIVQKLKMNGESKSGLLVLDHHLGKRE
ncbi:ferritin [Candidatus Woesearchaeota archaeon]|nr:ferritin [Candidatus Woesearchaeota archaeon]